MRLYGFFSFLIFSLFSLFICICVKKLGKFERKLDKQLDLVQEKTKRAYLSQEILEAKMKVLFEYIYHAALQMPMSIKASGTRAKH